MNPVLVTMRGPGGPNYIEFRDLSNFEAGYIALRALAKQYPGLTWGRLVSYAKNQPQMAGWLTDLGKGVSSVGESIGGAVGSVTDWVGSQVKDTFSATGDIFGDAVRMLTDKEVIDGLNSSYKSFSESGGITGAVGGGMFSDLGGQGGSEKQVWDWIVSMGAGLKGKAAGGNVNAAAFGLPEGALPWVVAGSGVALLLLFRGGRK